MSRRPLTGAGALCPPRALVSLATSTGAQYDTTPFKMQRSIRSARPRCAARLFACRTLTTKAAAEPILLRHTSLVQINRQSIGLFAGWFAGCDVLRRALKAEENNLMATPGALTCGMPRWRCVTGIYFQGTLVALVAATAASSAAAASTKCSIRLGWQVYSRDFNQKNTRCYATSSVNHGRTRAAKAEARRG